MTISDYIGEEESLEINGLSLQLNIRKQSKKKIEKQSKLMEYKSIISVCRDINE